MICAIFGHKKIFDYNTTYRNCGYIITEFHCNRCKRNGKNTDRVSMAVRTIIARLEIGFDAFEACGEKILRQQEEIYALKQYIKAKHAQE